jgi:hypothetical protein
MNTVLYLSPPLQCRNGASIEGWIAQLVEQRTENPRVLGSIPSPATSVRFLEFTKNFSKTLKGINFNRKIGQRTLDDDTLSNFVQNFEKIPVRDENFSAFHENLCHAVGEQFSAAGEA